MTNHPIILAALLAIGLVTSMDAFVVPFRRSKSNTSKGNSPTHNSFNRSSNRILRRLLSTVAEGSPAITRLFIFENRENDQGALLDITAGIKQSTNLKEGITASTLALAKPDALQDSKAATAQLPTQHEQEGSLSSDLATAQERSKGSSTTRPPTTTGAQRVGRSALSTLVETSGFSASAPAVTVALAGLAVARSALGQRQKKLDEEKRNLEQQQRRLETESAKLQKDTSQSNIFLSTIGSVAIGTALTTGGFVEKFTESTVRSLDDFGGGMNLENGIKESVKGGGFKRTAGTVVERPALSQEKLPYLEREIAKTTMKQQTKRQATDALRIRKEELSLQQRSLEDMAAKREAAIAVEESRLKAIADKEERLRLEEEMARRVKLAEKNEATRVAKDAREAEALQLEVAKEETVRKEAEEARVKKEAEVARIKEAEEVRTKKEVEAARMKEIEEIRITKEAEAARLKQSEEVRTEETARMNEAEEEATIQKEKEEIEDQLQVLEKESNERARMESILREQRALDILRRQEEELVQQQDRSMGGRATAAGVNVLRDYVSRLNGEFDSQLPGAIDVDKLQILLKQLGLPPDITGGIAAILVVGGGITAIKKVVEEAEGNPDDAKETNEPRYDKRKSLDVEEVVEANLSSQVAKLLQTNRGKTSRQPSTARKTLKIPVEGIEGENTTTTKQTSKSIPTISTDGRSTKQTPPSSKLGVSNRQPKIKPPPARNVANMVITQTGLSPSKPSSSKLPSSPYQRRIPPSASNTSVPSFKTTYSVDSPEKNSIASIRSWRKSRLKDASTSGSAVPSNKFGYSLENIDGTSGKQANSFFNIDPEQGSPRKEQPSSLGTSLPEVGSKSSFGFPPLKSPKLPNEEKLLSFGRAPKQIVPKQEKILSSGASETTSSGLLRENEVSPFGVTMKKADFGYEESSPFVATSNSTYLPNNFGSPEKSLGQSFSNQVDPLVGKTSKQPSIGKEQVSLFINSTPKDVSTDYFGAPTPKSTVSPNGLKSSEKKFVAPPPKQTSFEHLSAQNPVLFGAFGSASPTSVQQSVKKMDPPFWGPRKQDVDSKVNSYTFGNNKTPGAESSRFSPPKQSSVKHKKMSFSPLSQRRGSPTKSMPSFSSSGPVYIPPTSKVNNDASLKNIYSFLDGTQKKISYDIQEKRAKELQKRNVSTTSGPKKSYSPFGQRKRVSEPTFGTTDSAFSSNASNASTYANGPNKSYGISSGLPSLAELRNEKSFSPYGTKPVISASEPNLNKSYVASSKTSFVCKGVKKSFSPYGRKPKQVNGNLPKVDSSSFSFGAPPSEPFSRQNPMSPANPSSFAFGQGKASSIPIPYTKATNGLDFPGTSDNETPDLGNCKDNWTVSESKPFAATRFPTVNNDVGRDKKMEVKKMKQNRSKD